MIRIRRNDDDPVFLDERPAKLPKILQIPSDTEELEIRYKQTRWCVEMRKVKQRETVGIILVNSKQAGSFKTVETRIETFTHPLKFFNEMDSYSSETAELAETLMTHWDPCDLSEYGDIVELRRAWMVPEYSNGGRLGRAINALVEKLFVRRSLLILKAFPLEYESIATDENSDFLGRRQLAMKRHYRRILGVEALPGECGDNGWMFAIPSRLKDIVPEPSPQDHWS